MTQKLFYTDSFLSEFSAKVISCEKAGDNYNVVLDKTAFFATGGGQTCDSGTLGGVAVTDVFEKDEIIYHTVSLPLEVKSEVCGCVNFKERLKKMQNHTGEHMISGAAYKLFGANNFGFHLGDGFITCDLDKELSPEQLVELEDTVNMWISENHKVIQKFYENQAAVDCFYRCRVELDTAVRIVEIEGCDSCACCAPHVNFTGQVGIVKIIDSIRYKGGVRITAVCGQSALDDYRALCGQNKNIQHLLSAKRCETAEAVEKLANEKDMLKYKLEEWKTRYAECLVAAALDKNERIVFLGDTADAQMLTKAVNALNRYGVVLCGNEGEYSFAAFVCEQAAKELAKEVKALGGSGGAKANIVRGKITLSTKQAKDLFEKYL